MARTRNIKPAFFDNDTLGSLDPLVRLLFIGLWCIADRDGRLEDRPRRIKKTLLGYDDATAEETSGMLQQLADAGFIVRYEAEGSEYIQIVNFNKHQNPNMKEKGSEIPPPPGFDPGTYKKHDTSTIQAQCKNGTGKDGDGEETPAPPAPAEPEDKTLQEKRFDTFWEAYPNKKAKQSAKKAWNKLKPNTDLFARIMAAVDRQKHSVDWTKDNGAYIPHPATWLNGGRWDDEVKEVANNGETGQRTTGGGAFGTTDQRGPSKNGVPAGFKSE